MLSIARHQIMIRNGIYLAETTFLDGVDAYNRHVMVLRDGTMRGAVDFTIPSEATLVLAASGKVK
jgi:hypothetical protein